MILILAKFKKFYHKCHFLQFSATGHFQLLAGWGTFNARWPKQKVNWKIWQLEEPHPSPHHWTRSSNKWYGEQNTHFSTNPYLSLPPLWNCLGDSSILQYHTIIERKYSTRDLKPQRILNNVQISIYFIYNISKCKQKFFKKNIFLLITIPHNLREKSDPQ